MTLDSLQSLPFQKVKHVVGNTEAQPVPNGGILIQVNGQLAVRLTLPPTSSTAVLLLTSARVQVDDESNPLPYSQTFHLCQDEAGQWFVQNDIFSLVLL